MEPLPRERSLVPIDDPLPEKMAKLKALGDAIVKAKREMEERKTYFYANAYTKLVRQRDALYATLPKLRVVQS